MQKLLKISEAAKLLAVHKSTLRYWDEIGLFKAFRTLGGHRRYTEAQIKTAFEASGPFPKSPTIYSNHKGIDWPTQRLKALERDGYQCQKCEERNDLLVHHIKPYAISQDNSLENLITLCRPCHGKEHAAIAREIDIRKKEKVEKN